MKDTDLKSYCKCDAVGRFTSGGKALEKYTWNIVYDKFVEEELSSENLGIDWWEPFELHDDKYMREQLHDDYETSFKEWKERLNNLVKDIQKSPQKLKSK